MTKLTDDLDRFKRAQNDTIGGFTMALAEMQGGRKRSHWIWYIFPQLAGLGHSSMAIQYGLQGMAEATAYLRDPVLRERLLVITRIVSAQLQQPAAPALEHLMGSDIDALKLVSSMTLFREVANRLHEVEPLADVAELATQADIILRAAAQQGYPECATTRRQFS